MFKPSRLKALVFDVFGTVVDWRGSIARDLTAIGDERGLTIDWSRFADDWRALYHPAMDRVRSGARPWTRLDALHRENLLSVLDQHRLEGFSELEIDHINRAWERLDPWPEAIAGLDRLKQRFIIGTLSNGNIGLLTRMAKRAGLPWDVVLSAELAQAYKPDAASYLTAAKLLDCAPNEVMLVAAHNRDLHGAAAAGLATGFVLRPNEHGPGQTTDLAPDGAWDVVAESLTDLADHLGCPP